MRQAEWLERTSAADWLRTRLAPSRHTTYFEVRDAIQQEGCPICRLVSKAVLWYLDMLLYEAVNDSRLHVHLRAARGFCHHHAWQLTHAFRNGAGRALLYREIMAPVLDILSDPALGAAALAGRLLPREACPACRSQAQNTYRFLDALLLHLPEDDFYRLYHDSDGLCLPHLNLALRWARRAEDVEVLLAVAARWAGTLRVATRTGLRGPTKAIALGLVGQEGLFPAPAVDSVPSAGGAAAELAPGQGCPVCRAGVAAADACLDELPSHARAETPPARSLCNDHAWRALEVLSPGRGAQLWQPAARATKALIAAEAAVELPMSPQATGLWSLLAPSQRPGRSAAERLSPQAPCPVCASQATAERQAALAVLVDGGDGDLCLPHLALALRLPAGAARRRALVSGQLAALRALRADLNEYLRKQDFHCHEARGDEADSPWRVVAHVAGAERLAAPPLLWTHPNPE